MMTTARTKVVHYASQQVEKAELVDGAGLVGEVELVEAVAEFALLQVLFLGLQVVVLEQAGYEVLKAPRTLQALSARHDGEVVIE